MEEEGERLKPPPLARQMSDQLRDALALVVQPAAGLVGSKPYYCVICLENQPADKGFKLENCKHVFCKDCLVGYARSKITEGQVYVRCFHTSDDGQGTCGMDILQSDIQSLLVAEPQLLAKYHRFKFNSDNKNARDCPKCSTVQLGDPANPAMQCDECGAEFCFFHSDAHVNRTCEAYERETAEENKQTMTLLSEISKPCPGCGLHVTKSGGCNHMKCSKCNTAFCWLCGQQIDDSTFPVHFQWYNLQGCPNMQMNEAIVPSAAEVARARCLAFGQLCVLGPLSFICTVAFSLACFPCMLCVVADDKQPHPWRRALAGCMSGWGMFWIFVLVIMPPLAAFGALYLATLLIYVVTILPIQCMMRVRRGESDPLPPGARAMWNSIKRRCCCCCCSDNVVTQEATNEEILAQSFLNGFAQEQFPLPEQEASVQPEEISIDIEAGQPVPSANDAT